MTSLSYCERSTGGDSMLSVEQENRQSCDIWSGTIVAYFVDQEKDRDPSNHHRHFTCSTVFLVLSNIREIYA